MAGVSISLICFVFALVLALIAAYPPASSRVHLLSLAVAFFVLGHMFP